MKRLARLIPVALLLVCQNAYGQGPREAALREPHQVTVDTVLSYSAANHVSQETFRGMVESALTHRGVHIARHGTDVPYFRINVSIIKISNVQYFLILEADSGTRVVVHAQGNDAPTTRCLQWEHERSMSVPEPELQVTLRNGVCGIVAQFVSEHLGGRKGVFEDCKE